MKALVEKWLKNYSTRRRDGARALRHFLDAPLVKNFARAIPSVNPRVNGSPRGDLLNRRLNHGDAESRSATLASVHSNKLMTGRRFQGTT